MSKEFDPGLLTVGPNQRRGDEALQDIEDQAYRIALSIFLQSSYLEVQDVEAILFADPNPADKIVTDVSYDRFVSDPIPVTDSRSVVFDQLVLLEDSSDAVIPAAWCASRGMFSMGIHGNHLEEVQAQYIFVMNPQWPINGEIYHGFEITEATRVRGKHLNLLHKFLQGVFHNSLAINAEMLARYPTLMEPKTALER